MLKWLCLHQHLPALLVKSKVQEDLQFSLNPAVPTEWNAAQIPSWRLLLCQRAVAEKIRTGKDGKEIGTRCVSALFGARGAPSSQKQITVSE